MTSRERVLASIAHKTPDKVPVDLGATPSSGISAIAYSNLVKHLGKNLPVLIYDVVQQLAQPDDSIIDLFGIDVLDIGRAFDTEPTDWYPVKMANGAKAFYPKGFHPTPMPDGSWVTYDDDGKTMLSKMPVNGTFFDETYFPYSESGYPADYTDLDAEMHRIMWSRDAHSPWNHAGEADFYSQLRDKALYLRQHTDKALMIVCGCNLFEWGTFLRRMDNFLMDLFCDPDNVARILDELLKRHLATLEKVCASVGDVVDIIRFGDDLGMTQGPFMDVDTYRHLFKPRHKILCDYVKTHSKMHTFIHSCGSISDLMPDMIEAGIEIFNPVQTNAHNMSPEFLKKEFGKDCTFWGGGIENVGTLNKGSRQQIRDMVFERMEIFSKGGGFVFNTVHNILPDVPPENVVTLFEAVRDFNNK
jgi:uroporphyrinogen decarboxylase